MCFRNLGWNAVFLFLALLVWSGAAHARDVQPRDNLLANGGFENGADGWMWQQWRGRPLPGFIDRDDPHEGSASFRFHEKGAERWLYMAKEAKPVADHDHVLSIALRPDGMPEDAARVRVLIDGSGWLGRETGRPDVVRTGGSHGWKSYTVRIPAAALGDAERMTVFVYHDDPGQGTLGIDAVSLHAVPAAAARPLSVTYTRESPTILVVQDDARLAIDVTPEQALYRTGALPRVAVRSVALPGARLTWRLADGFGQVLREDQVAADGGAALDIDLPPGHGYYEVVATLRRGVRTVAEARRSIGVLPPPAEPVGEEPFGLWIQGMENYPELGVRWTRDGVWWRAYEAQGKTYLENRRKLYRQLRDSNIRVIAFPKHPHPHQTSREVIEDTPEAWRALEEWWTTMVRALAGQVDAWGVVNEPMRGHWKGSDELIVRYWELMRRIVDRHDPGTPLIGPSLSPNTPSLVAQYRDLLEMGLGRYIDIVEMHTYISDPDDGAWERNTRRIAEMTRRATGRDLPIWSTEHGSSATHRDELVQARHLMRSWLEAMRIGYPVMIWHMFSHPQGSDTRERQFGIFRNVTRRGVAAPQPRPAGLAYGVMTRQLAGAEYRTRLVHLGPSVRAYAFERDGKAMVALWSTDGKSHDVTLPADDAEAATVTGMFGRVEPLGVRDGLVRVTVDRDPKFVASLPAALFGNGQPARMDTPVETLPGGSARATMTLVNPASEAARIRIVWQPPDGWEVASSRGEWTLRPGQEMAVPLTVAARQDLPVGHYQLHARTYLDGAYAGPLVARASVLPQVTVGGIEPRFNAGRPVIAGTLHRLDPVLDAAEVRLAGDRSAGISVPFRDGDEAAFVLPVNDAPADRLRDLGLIVSGSGGKVQLEEDLRLSFVPATYMERKPAIDGNLDDWPGTGSDGALDVRWGWDERNLYLAARVRNPTFVQTQMITEMWKDDSLQIGLAPGDEGQLVRPFRPGLQEAEMVELDVALRRDGPAMYRHRTVNSQLAPVDEVRQDQIRYAVRHDRGVTTYEVRIPVEQAGLNPLRDGQVLRASLLANLGDDDDGQRRGIEWFHGLRTDKDPALFGHLILQK